MEIQLGDLYLNKGGSVNPANFKDEPFEYYSIPAYDSGKPEVIKGAEIGSSKKVFQPNDVILSRIVPHIRRCWIVGENQGIRQIGSGEWITFRSEDIEPSYLRHYLMSNDFNAKFLKTIKGVGGSLMRADPKQVAKFKFLLPPLPQQKKIAAILDAADGYRQKTKALIAKYDELTQSLFLDMFGDPVTNPMSWEKASLETCLQKVDKIGKSFSEDSIQYVDIASVDNIRNVITETTSYSINERPSRAQQILLSGDIVFSTVRPNLKNIAINHIDGRIGSTGFFVCRTDQEKLNNFFLYKVLLSDSTTDYFVGITSGANYPAVKSTDMRKFQVITPPLDIQNQFAERVQAIEVQKAQAQESLAKAEDLFNSLLQKAFKGEL